MGNSRKKVSADVRMMVLHEAGYKCGRPTCRNILTLDLHHLEPVSVGGPDTAENLLPLCGYCHDMHHAGHFPPASIRAWKFLLLALNEAFDRRSVDLLLVLAKLQRVERVTSDGLPTYAPLIAGGMAHVHERRIVDGGSGTPCYTVAISEKGVIFVNGWQSGDQAAALSFGAIGTATAAAGST